MCLAQALQTKIERQRAAAESGDVNEQFELALLLTEGLDDQQKEAFSLFGLLADADHGAKNLLGWCYDEGCGVKQDHKKAFESYREAAELGHTTARYNLGLCYRFGKGTEKDEKKAAEAIAKQLKKAILTLNTIWRAVSAMELALNQMNNRPSRCSQRQPLRITPMRLALWLTVS